MPLKRLAVRISAIAAAGALLASCVSLFTFEPERNARAPVLDGFGVVDFMVTTPVPAARQWFHRGLLQAYAFNHAEAVRAFKAALAVDPACALCAWGVAWALGPNINAVEREDLREARRYVALARRHAAAASPRERALIEALAVRYGATGDAATPASSAAPLAAPQLAAICGAAGAKAADPLDIAYAAQMRTLVDAEPMNPDLSALYAEAVMIATRVDWWDRASGAPAGQIGAMTQQLERALAQSPDHVGLNHYLIHAVDQSRQPQRALAAADRLGLLAPQAPHLVHMPAHIYVRTARFGDAARVNDAALAAEVRQTERLTAQGFDSLFKWDGHNLHFLWFAALMDGRGEHAMAQARRLAERSAKGQGVSAELMRSLPLFTLVRLERWAEVLNEPMVAGDAGLAAPLRDYARGVALARTGQLDAARTRQAALHAALDAPALVGKTIFGADAARTVLEVLDARLQAEVAVIEGRADAAQDALQRGARLEAALEANEPPLLGAGSRNALGSLMLRAQRAADAEAAYRADLAEQPGSGWALRGLQRSVALQGRRAESEALQREFDRAWAGADAGLRNGPVH